MLTNLSKRVLFTLGIVRGIWKIDNRSLPNDDGRFTPFVAVVGVALAVCAPYLLFWLLSFGAPYRVTIVALLLSLATLWALSAWWQEKIRGTSWFLSRFGKLTLKEKVAITRMIVRHKDPLYFRLFT